MRTECKQVFHGLFQRKVKARFDGGKITCAGVLLLREVRTGFAGLEQCFTDHRDPRLIGVKELLGADLWTVLGLEDLNDHDQLRTDPMLAVAVEKADPLGPAAGRRPGKGVGRQVHAEPVGTDRRAGRWGAVQEGHGWRQDRPVDGRRVGPRIGAL